MNRRTTPAARNEQAETGRHVAAEKKERQTATVDAAVHRRKFREDDRNRLAQGGDGGAVARAAKNSTSKEQKPGREMGAHQYDLGKQDLLKLKEEIEKTASVVQTRTSSTSSSSYHTAAERHSKSEPPASPGMPQLRMFSWDFGSDFAPVKPTQGGPIGALPVKAQEYRLIKDLLNCMIGCDGVSIHSRLDPHGKRVFSIDDTADVSLREIAGRILPLCASYSTVMRFAEDKWEPGQGLVNQALAAALRHLLHDQFTLVAQLEHQLVNRGGLTLQKMWFYVQPALAYMETLASVVRTLRKENCYGGKILGALHKRTVSLTGDAKSRDICLHLIKAASVPYFDMLERWVYRGHIRDPNNEFMVCDKSQVKKEDMSVDHSDNYWNSRYALRPDMVPDFLRPIQDKILITGKYHNVILQCGEKPKSSPEDRLCYSVDEREYGEKIERSYQLASRTLLDLLMQKVDLMGRLRSVKHFFLMDQGDFVVQFMDMSEEELSKELDDIVPTRLEVLLQLALSTSSVASDRYRDCVKHQVLEWSLLTQVEKIMTSDGADKWEPGQGLVNQALAAALRHLLHDQFTLVAQLEHQLVNRGGLTLQKMWFYVQPALAYMETLASVIRTLRKENCYGGKILGALHKRTVSLTGDAKSRDICLHLIKAASVPYFDMLERWVYRGHIRDPNHEFMVCDKSQVKKEDMSVDQSDNYWNSRYALRPDMVPDFLRPIQDKILITGKYHNVILQCGEKPKSSPEDRLCYSVDEREYGEKIERSYQLASRTLLDLLMQKVDLMGRLRSVKHFFLMDQGDFVVQFMDMSEEELSKELDDIVPTRLEVLLQLALSTSSVASDRYRDCVKHQVLEWSLLTQVEKIMTSDSAVHGTVCQESISGHEAFTLNYEVNWPLNLVLSTTSLGCYQMVFRYLFYCTHVERMLSKAWVLDKRSKRHGTPYPTRAFGLRQRMVDFVKNLQYFITVEVVEPSWHVFQDKMGRVQTIDEVLQLHTELTDSFMSLCMLSNYPVFKVIYGILGLCLDFASFIASVPYFDMLERWVYRGHIRDPNNEFMVCDKSQVKKEDMSVDHSDNYWNSRYALRPDMVPDFLRPIQDKILITGKYHNVILQCGEKPKSSPEDRLCYSVDEREYGEKIERSYQLASRTLLDLLMQKVDLMGRLRSVKHFFLMDQGDFVVQFMDMSEEELSKELDDIVPTRLEVLLQLALSTSSVASDRYRDCVKHQVLEWSLLTQVEKIMTSDGAVHGTVCQESISGHEAFTLNYEVNWPLNLSLGCYQMVFRYLFYCTHVERMLSKAWVLDKRSKRHGTPYPTRAFGLRQRMVDFVKNLQYFITVEVVEPSWHVFQDKMGRVQTIDEVLQLHTELTDSFMSLCMLSNYPVFKVIYGILGLCLDFASFIQKQASECEAAKSQLGYIAEDEDSARPETPFDRKIGEVEESFNTSLSTLKEGIRRGLGGDRSGRGNSLVEMLHRIDFNEFYSTSQSSGSL
ncbi:gamma-tubulin complex component 2 isoform X1 [Ixodes scapularis]